MFLFVKRFKYLEKAIRNSNCKNRRERSWFRLMLRYEIELHLKVHRRTTYVHIVYMNIGGKSKCCIFLRHKRTFGDRYRIGKLLSKSNSYFEIRKKITEISDTDLNNWQLYIIIFLYLRICLFYIKYFKIYNFTQLKVYVHINNNNIVLLFLFKVLIYFQTIHYI